MSYQKQSFINSPNKFIIPFVGDNFPQQNMLDQISNITKNTQNMNIGPPKQQFNIPHTNNYIQESVLNPADIPYIKEKNPTEQNISSTEYGDRYDPYVDFLQTRGLINNNNTVRYETTAINIDSAFRQINPMVSVFESHKINYINPLNVDGSSNILTINDPDNTYSVGDRIMLSGVSNPQVVIRCGGNYNGLIFTMNSSLLIINYNFENPGIPINLQSSYDISNNLITTITNLVLNISGFNGNSTGTGTYYNNIPINNINGNHTATLLKDASNNYYATINLNKIYTEIYGNMTTMNPFNVTITYNYISGIPTNIINAGYPITATNIIDYHIITSTTKDTYTVNLLQNSLIKLSFGNNIIVSKINDIKQGYDEPNYYIINLDKIYKNVYMVRLISSEFPNSENVIKNTPETAKNNRLYWQNQDDGDYIYYIEIPPGNYNPNDLMSALETLFYETPRINYNADSTNPNTPIYTNHNYIKVDINTNTDIVTFKSYREAFFVEPFINVQPSIATDPTKDPSVPYVGYILTIYHPSHNVTVNTQILISGAISYFGIPVSTLNSQQTVINVIDANNYQIKLPAFNLGSQRENNGGGASVGIYVPDDIKFHFEYPDTIGQLLGFRNVGQYNSITPFNTIIKNNEPYDDEFLYNNVGQISTITNNAVELSGDSYILMSCTELNTSASVSPVQNFFSKILLSGLPGKMLFNTFISVPKIFFEPISELSSLEFTFYSPNGSLYNFNGINHSFTLEITTITNILKDTMLSDRTIKTLS